MKKKHLIIVILTVLGLIALSVIIPFYLFIKPSCDVREINKFTSPDNKYQAHAFIQNCGATSDYATKIVLKNIQTNDEAQILALRGGTNLNLRVSWESADLLKINFEANNDRLYNKMAEFEGVKIEVLQNGKIIEP